MENLAKHLESLIFTAERSITFKQLKDAIDKSFEQDIDKKDIQVALDSLVEKYKSDDFAIEINAISGGYQFMSKAAYHNTVSSHIKLLNKKNLSKAALETLAIIAYKQPLVKSEIESIRGVNCDYSVQKLLDKELIEISGRSKGPGRPLLYGTSEKFMDHFGIQSLKDLPQLKDLKQENDLMGEQAPVEDVAKTNVESTIDEPDLDSELNSTIDLSEEE